MRRWIGRVALGLGVIALVAVAAIGGVLWTETGTRIAVDQARSWLPEGVQFGAVHGRLGREVALEDLSVERPGLSLQVGRVWLRWSPLALLDARLDVAELGARDVRYTMRPVEQPEPAGGLPDEITLPVAVAVGRVVLDDATLRTAPEARPVPVDRLQITGATFVDSRLAVEEVTLQTPQLTAKAGLAITAADAYPLTAEVDWRLTAADLAPLHGSLMLGGSLASLDFRQRLDAPYGMRTSGSAQGLVAADVPIEVTADVVIDQARLAAIRSDLPDATVSLDAQVSGPVHSLTVQAVAPGQDAERRRFVAELNAQREGDAIRLQRLRIRQPDRPGTLNGHGTVALGGDVSADLVVDWSELAWPLAGAPRVHSPRGRLEVSGPPRDYRFLLDTRVTSDRAPAVDLRLDGGGTLETARAELEAQSEAGRAAGEGRVSWADGVDGSVRLQLRELDPSVLLEDWPGRVDADLEASASMSGDELRVNVGRLDAGGSLREQPLSADVRGSLVQQGDRRRLDVSRLQLRLGASRAEVEGHVSDRTDFEWTLASDDLSGLLPDASGSVSASGRVTGTLPQVRLVADVSGQALEYAGQKVESVALDGDVDLSGAEASTLMLDAKEAEVQGRPVARLTLRGSGTPADHRLRLDVAAQDGRAALRVDGAVDDPWGDAPAWRYRLTEGELAYGDLAPWTLAGPAPGRIAAAEVQVDEQCWRTGQARLCFQGHRNARGFGGRLNLARLPFDYFRSLLPEGLDLAADLSAAMDVSGTMDGSLTGQGRVSTTAGRIAVEPGPDGAGVSTAVALQPSELVLKVDGGRAEGRLDLNLEHGSVRAAGRAATSVVTAGAFGSEAPQDRSVSATLGLNVPDLAFVSRFVPALDEARGAVRGEWQLEGSLDQPRLSGAIELQNGAFTVPEPGLELTAVTAAVEGHGDSLGLVASASSGDGDVRVDGRMSLPGRLPPTATLEIAGTGFQVMNNDEARLFLSPDLRIEADEQRIAVTGKVHVPRGEITPDKRPPAAVTVSEDQVLVSREPESSPVTRPLHAEVRLTLGDDVHFEGFGLTANLEGNVLVHQEPDTPVTANGEIRIVDGEYRAYGQGLVIETGRIYFAGGPVTEPALDVRAVRRPEEGILVGTHVQGTLQSPEFALFSEPAMSEQEQLSYLVLGRSPDDAPDGESSALNRAALAMGLKGGDFLAKNLGQRVGVDEIGIQSGSGEAGAPSDPNEAALVVGKYLSPRLYVSYGIGLFDPESVLKLQYEIARNWKVVTESSGESTGADILYSVEVGDS